ncbi:hypothetical protein PKHYL_07770 [Psychrobacter sp. KH172YL61]|uniref:hypothetical protein n=1 Tax=Psychrobacter sp. KH172YL61 TaxID=2517899 RepID=UPI0010B22FF9|nr:hypothetical protein [Psychrobacter sp. KH172YL61]BBI66586.1 hypothetical protein PKHYL_07770 [Psychrobacter sp. KH172YL61]
MSDNHTKPNLKAQHGAHNRKQTGKRGLLLRFTIFMAWVAGIGLLLSLVACQQVQPKQIATDDSSGYYIGLSKSTSGQASRGILAFLCLIIAQPLKLLLYNLAQPHKRTHAPQGGKPSYLR